MSDFLKAGYERPKAEGDYMKFQQGSNTFRITSNPKMGFVGWYQDAEGNKKPVRKEDALTFPGEGLDKAPKFFWGLEVYNYAAKKLQVLEITQSSILDKIELLNNNPAWGDPKGYDIVVTRTGEKLNTEYDVQSSPPAEMNNTIKQALSEGRANLDEWFNGGEAFSKESTMSADPAGDQAAQEAVDTQGPTAVQEAESIIGGTGVNEEAAPVANAGAAAPVAKVETTQEPAKIGGSDSPPTYDDDLPF